MLFLVVACRDNEKEVYSSSDLDIQRGGYVKFDKAPAAVISLTDKNTSGFSAGVSDPNSSAEYLETAIISGTIGGTNFSTTNLKIRVTSFPGTLNVTLKQIADALGKDVNLFNYGDNIRIRSIVKTKDGRYYPQQFTIGTNSYNSNNGYTNGNTAQLLLATDVSFTLACPSVDLSQLVGTFKVVRDDWQDYNIGDTVTIVKGDKANQLKMSCMNNTSATNSSTLYFIYTVNPDGSVVVSANEPIAYPAKYTVGGTGYVFSCIGKIDLSLSFATITGQKFILQKI